MNRCSRRTFLARASAIPALGLLAPWGLAQSAGWPPITKLVVPFPAGGGVDTAARTLAELLAKSLNTTVVVENKPGATGLIAAQAVANAPGDGATILYMFSGQVTSQAMTGKPDLLRQFRPVTKLSSAPHMLVVPGNSPYKTQAELLAAIQAKPGKLNFGSGGIGSSTHLMFERLAARVPGGLNAANIPFKSAYEAAVGMLGGEIDFTFTLPTVVADHIKTGKLRALSVTSPIRLARYPSVPTVAEAGVPGYADEPWGGLALPASAPDALVARLAEAARAATASPKMTELLAQSGSRADLSSSPGAFADAIRSQLAEELTQVKRLGLTQR